MKNEVRVNVLNPPYGGFPWLDMPQYANTNWYNAHNFYGDLKDIDAATLADVRVLHQTYYSPGNAVLVVTGDFDRADDAEAWIEKYFAPIPGVALPASARTSRSRARRKSIRASKADRSRRGRRSRSRYHMPPRNTPEYYAMGLLDQILLQGHDSWLYQALVQRGGYAGDVNGGINLARQHVRLRRAHALDGVALPRHATSTRRTRSSRPPMPTIDSLRNDAGRCRHARPRAGQGSRRDLYDMLGRRFGFGRADLLASFALFDNDPARINTLERSFRAVTPALIQRTAREYLRPEDQTVLTIVPKGKAPNATTGQ